jgi:hypothetical protein
VIALMIAGIVGPAVSAHRLDEYLQAARLAVDPGRVDLELAMTPGIAVADAIIADIDRDHDGSLSPLEQQAYATSVLSAIDCEVDGRRLPLQSMASSFPDLDAMRRGVGTILLHSGAVMTSQSAGAHRVFFRNTHRQDVSVYLANAVAPASDRLAITAQHRDRDQRELTIDYAVRTRSPRHAGAWLLVSMAAASTMAKLMTRRSRPTSTS